MYSSYMNFNNQDVVEYFNSLGVPTKVERGGRIFPQSDKAQDIVDALKRELVKYCRILKVEKEEHIIAKRNTEI